MTLEVTSNSGSDTIAFEIERLHQDMGRLARNGEWNEIALVTKKRDELLFNVPLAGRAAVIKAAIDSNDDILKLAVADRQAVAEQLKTVRRNRAAARQYESHQDT